MQKLILTILFLTLLVLVNDYSISAQLNVFTYQGSLKSGAAAVSGLYDFEFDICDAPSGGNVLSTQTLVGVSVTNGIFTVDLNASPTVFSGAARYLEIRIKPSAGATFETLAPRQLITSAPYALKSFNATNADFALNSLNATNATNAINAVNAQTATTAGFATNAQSAVSATNATNATNAQTAQTALNSNNLGGFAANQYFRFKWNVINADTVASSNQGYIINESSEIEIVLPPTPLVGDIVRVTQAGTGNFSVRLNAGQTIVRAADSNAAWIPVENSPNCRAAASSSDGTKLAAVVQSGPIFISQDAGKTWVAHESARNWTAITSSADGTKLVAVTNEAAGGLIYVSGDSGNSWTPRESNRFWSGVASSADGTKLVAVGFGERIYTSTDSGVSWTPRDTAKPWTAVASSSDGTKLVAVTSNSQIYTSTDSGAFWTPHENARPWISVASSADGTSLAAVVSGGQIYTSTNSGLTWTPRETNRNWTSITSSADGTKLAAVVTGGQIYVSTDSGISWAAQDSNRSWQAVASSADGSQLVALGGQIYLNPRSAAALSVTGTSLGSVELIHVGGGKFLLLGSKGNIVLY